MDHGWSNVDLNVDTTTVVEDKASTQEKPTCYRLSHNYPNPFNPMTTIEYQLPTASRISLKIYNRLGQLVYVVLDDMQRAGYHQIHWDGSDSYGQTVSSGLYFCHMKADNYEKTIKMLILR